MAAMLSVLSRGFGEGAGGTECMKERWGKFVCGGGGGGESPLKLAMLEKGPSNCCIHTQRNTHSKE